MRSGDPRRPVARDEGQPSYPSKSRAARGMGVAVTALLVALVAPPAHGAELWAPTLPMAPLTQQHLDLFADGTAYAYSAQDNIVYASTDFGRTWVPRTTAPGLYASVAFGRPELGYAATFGGDLLVTTDGARTWTRKPGAADGGRGATYNALDVAARGRVVVVGGTPHGCPLPRDGAVAFWYSADYGRTWRERRLPFFGTVRNIDMLDARTGVAIVYDRYNLERDGDDCQYESESNTVWLTRDGFKTMRRIFDCSGDETCSAATMASPSRILVGTNNADLYLSRDGGRRFARIGRFSEPWGATGEQYYWIGALAFATPRVGYMSTKGGGTWRTTDGGHTWTQEVSSEVVWGLGLGDLAVADAEHAIAGGPNFVITRVAV